MELNDLKILLQRYFDGETSPEEEKALTDYFSSGKVDADLAEYAGFFGGLTELSGTTSQPKFEEQVMDYILEHENQEKNRYRSLWKTVTGIAAAVILILGGLLVYEQYQTPFDDTFSTPEEAYAYTQKTLQFVSGTYNSGVSQLSKTKKYNEALAQLQKMELVSNPSKPLSKGLSAVNKGFDEIKSLQKKIK
jgi:hypothetical protein